MPENSGFSTARDRTATPAPDRRREPATTRAHAAPQHEPTDVALAAATGGV